MQDADDDDAVIVGKVEDQIVAVRKVSQIGRKVGPLGCDPGIECKKLELLVEIVAKLSGRSGIVGGDVSNNAFQILKGNSLEAKRRH